jgi:hypothetical protein
MRRVLAITLKFTGFALGLPAGGVLITLLWPDVMSDLYSAHALRHFVGMFVMGIVLCLVICWPFWWVADRIFPEGRSDNADPATPCPSNRK